jgi:replicative DNA helicase
MDGKNVLYITLEMAEERIAERIDANLLNVDLDDLNDLNRVSKDLYQKKIDRVRKETTGKLIIKEYPTATAGTGHFRHLLNELSIKRNFKPDIIYVDYLNIAISMRVKPGQQINSYTYIKAIAEELRGLAVERDVPIVSATQTTRKGFTNSDPGLEDTSESFGLPATADFMIAMINSDDLQAQGCVKFKQLKNRYSDPVKNKTFKVGVDRAKMKLYNVEAIHQDLISDEDKPVMDNTKSGRRINMEKVAGKLGVN